MKTNNKKYFLFSLHGIGATKEIFAYLAPALAAHWQRDEELVYIPFDYHTGQDNLTTHDFAKSFGAFVDSSLKSTPLKAGDKISIIMHSQGGIIGLLWLEQIFSIKSPLISYLDSFITLATPFWGSKVAEIGNEVRRIWDLTGKPFFLPTGKKELSEMAFQSDTINYLRQIFIDQKHEEFRNFYSKKLRTLNIAAFSKMLGGLNHIVGEAGIYESDRAVSIPSARTDFYFYQSLNMDYLDEDLIPLNEIKHTELSPFYLINAVHHTYAPNDGPIVGIAQIPKECISTTYAHGAFGIILNHLHCHEISQESSLIAELKFFILDINLHVENGTDIDLKDIAINFTQLNGDKIKWSEITIGWILVNRPDYKKRSETDPNQCRFNYQGQIKNGADNYLFKTAIELKGYRTRNLEVMVRPGFSTFIDITLAKKT